MIASALPAARDARRVSDCLPEILPMDRLRPLLLPLLALSVATACARPAAAQLPVGELAAAVATEDPVLVAFRVLFDDVIGDSADTLCIGIATAPSSADQADPSAPVLRALRARGVTVWPHSECVADEKNYGPTRGALRLLDVTPTSTGALLVHAEAIADRTARYECVVPRRGHRYGGGRCQMISLR